MMLVDIVEEHVEEVALLWQRRAVLSNHPNQTLHTLSELDERIEAHLDGVRLDPGIAWAAAERLFKLDDAGEIFSMACAAFETGDAARLDVVLNAAASDPALASGLVAALMWLPYEQARVYIDALLRHALPTHRCLGIAASVAHRVDPGDSLRAALYDGDAALCVCACRAVGELGRGELVSPVPARIHSDNEAVVFWSNWSAALLGDNSAATALKRFLTSRGHTGPAVAVAFRRLPLHTARDWIEELADDEANARVLLQAVGVVGDPAYVPGLIGMMRVKELARMAADSFCAITGVHLANEKLEATAPVNWDADAPMGMDELLSWPDVSRVSAWWEKNAARFNAGTRYLLGKPVSIDQLQLALRHGNQSIRRGAALELAMLRPGTPVLNTSAPASRQTELLFAMR